MSHQPTLTTSQQYSIAPLDDPAAFAVSIAYTNYGIGHPGYHEKIVVTRDKHELGDDLIVVAVYDGPFVSAPSRREGDQSLIEAARNLVSGLEPVQTTGNTQYFTFCMRADAC